jgi:leader peptidase (prepilin peptidase) / N-methyltransferase
VTSVERDVAPRAPGSETDVALERSHARRTDSRSTGLRFGWPLVGAGVLLVSFAVSPGAEGLFGGALGLLMLGVVAADARRFVIPNALSGGAFALGVIHGFVASPDSGFEGALTALSRAALAAGLLLLVRFAYQWFRGREGLGLGDVKLAGVAGAWLSLPMLPITIEIAAIAALAAYVFRQRKRMRVLRPAARVPFGAYFAPAIWLGWVMDTMLPYLT